MRSSDRVVIVGASIGGLTVAESLRAEGFDGAITLLGEEAHLPHTRPPLSKQILAGEWEPEQAAVRTSAELEALRIRVSRGCTATGVDVANRTLHTTDGLLGFDELVIATGTRPRAHPTLPAAASLKTMDDALQLRDRMDGADRVAVIGTGILGSEIASAARERGAAVLLVGRSSTLGFGSAGGLLSEQLSRLHEDHGVEIRLGTEIAASIPTRTGSTEVRFDDGTSRAFELVVTASGGEPCTGWLESSSIVVHDGVVCDSVGIAAPGVSAVGDVAAWFRPLTGTHSRIEHQSNAIEQAIAVAARIATGTPTAQPVPLFWSEIHGARIHPYGQFDRQRLLAELTRDAARSGTILGSHDVAGRLRGVVGWNAPPRDFRAARRAIDELHFVRNDAARQLRRGSSTMVAFVAWDIGDPLFVSVARGARRRAAENGLSLVLADTEAETSTERQYLQLFEEQRVRGILFSPSGDAWDFLQELDRRRVPAVLIDQASRSRRWASVTVNDILGGELAVGHLLDTGRTRIAVVGGPQHIPQIVDRVTGARHVVKRSTAHLEIIDTSVRTLHAGIEVGMRLARRDPHTRPDGVFCINDDLASGVIFALARHGVRVPEDIAVIGYNDTAADSLSPVPLSSVRQPHEQFGSVGIDLLMEEIQAEPQTPRRSVVFDPELIVRRSTQA